MSITKITKIRNKIIKLQLPLIKTLLDIVFQRIIYKVSPDEYFLYEYYNKSRWARKHVNTTVKNYRIWKKYNSKEAIIIAENKSIFYEQFKEFVNREVLVIQQSSIENIKDFLSKHQKVIAKPVLGMQGQGIKLLNIKDIDIQNVKEKFSNYIFEEVITQHDLINDLNPSSINTIRIVTAKKHKKLTFIGAVIRIGRNGRVTDNFSTGGIVATVDIDTGIIVSPAYDIDKNIYIFHPDSNHKIVGLEIPHWDKVIRTVTLAANTIEGLNYIGWDIAVTNDGVDLVEINHNPAARTIQLCNTGTYKKIVDSLK